MKFTALFAVAALTAAVSTGANAAVVNFSGSNVNMDTVEIGQTGTITNLYETLFTLPPNVVGGGTAFGFLPTNAKITFSYTFSGLHDGVLDSYASYNYNNGGNVFAGSSTASSDGSYTAVGTINGASSAPLTFASADLNIVDPGISTGTVSFVNVSGAFAQFEALFFGLLSQLPPGVGTATYAVSAVPLPAALPLFGAALLGMFGLARRQRKTA